MLVRQTTIYILFFLLDLVICQNDDYYLNDLFNSQSNEEDSDRFDGIFQKNFSSQSDKSIEENSINGEGEVCTCVRYYECYEGMINMHGRTLIEFRMNDPSNPCEGELDKCCNHSKIDRRGVMKEDAPQAPRSCGLRNADGIGVHFVDMSPTQSQYGEFPWMVAIMRESENEDVKDKDDSFQCGGSLIHPKVVLTAAHCVSKEDATYSIRAGEWHTKIVSEHHLTQDRGVACVIKHENFDIETGFNDIALMILKKPVDLAEHIGLVCLPEQDDVTTEGTCIFTGWGKNFIGLNAKPSEILKKITLPVVPRPQCQMNLRRTFLGRYFELHKNFMCAGGEPGIDSCEGDGGGPLVCPMRNKEGQYFQAGILSYGAGCGRKNVPGVYVSVAKYRNWIDQKLESYDLDTSGYQA